MKNNIKLFRVKCGLTQVQLAKRLLVSRQTVNAMEKSKYVPSTLLALKLAKTFACDVSDIFELEPED